MSAAPVNRKGGYYASCSTGQKRNMDQSSSGAAGSSRYPTSKQKRSNIEPIGISDYPRPTPKQILETIGFQFSPDHKLGDGRYSKVIVGSYKSAQCGSVKKVAIKIIDLEKISHEFYTRFLPRELQNWKAIKHPHCVYLYKDFIKFRYQFAVMEVAEHGDLLTYVQKNGPVPENQSRIWILQLIDAVGYLHSHLGIAHRDIKLENVLLFEGNIVKMADFGFSKRELNADLSSTFCGSKSYSPPEILLGTAYDIFKADVWALGVCGYIMLTNRMPFREDVPNNSIIVKAQRERRYGYPKEISAGCRNTIDKMMTFDANQRPSIACCRKLPWFAPSSEALVQIQNKPYGQSASTNCRG